MTTLVYALSQVARPTTIFRDRTAAMREFENREIALGHLDAGQLRGDPATLNFIEGRVSFVRNSEHSLRIDAITLQETK